MRSQKDDGSYELLFKLEDDGVYYGTVKYHSKMVGTDGFTIICLEGLYLLLCGLTLVSTLILATRISMLLMWDLTIQKVAFCGIYIMLQYLPRFVENSL